MKFDLTGKLAVVTGSTSGIGFAIAAGLAETGAEVVVNGRSQDTVEAAKARILAAIPEARLRGVAADLGSPDGAQSFLGTVPQADILVNNLGIFEPKDFFAIPDADWMRFFEVNVVSGVRMSRAYLPGMMEQDWGRIVFVSSESALNIPTEMIHYGTTKTAQLAVARGLAKVARGTGVTVNSVLPGPTLTDGVEAMLRPQAEQEGKTVEEVAVNFVVEKRPSSILQRPATPQEVASMVVYLCSMQASATTGAAIRVDGGTIDSIV